MNEKRPMFDPKLIIAIGLTVLMWVGYQSYLHKKYPEAYNKTATTTGTDSAVPAATTNSDAATPTATTTTTTASVQVTNAATATTAAEEFLEVEDIVWKLRFSSKGMALDQVTLKNYSDREGKAIQFIGGTDTKNLETNFVGRKLPIDFKLTRVDEFQVAGEAVVNGMKIRKTYILNSSTYSIATKVAVENPDPNFSGIVSKLVAPVVPSKGGSFLTPSVEHQEFYINHDGSDNRVALAEGTEKTESFQKVSIAALASHYFAIAILNESDSIPEFQATSLVQSSGGVRGTDAVGTLSHPALTKGENFVVKYKAYMGPKSWNALESADKNLTAMINFGFFKTIAVWIFKLLLSIHATVGNWGVAIILLTIMVRALVLPFNIMSYKSMKVMSKIQPEIKNIREKYKNDAVKANQEIMRVMKDSRANPLGGCLPIFLQIPVFFALYQVLGQSIELYKSPFFLWITDLSQHDKFFVLPALMGITMFVQQKITPSTLDPAQQKIMLVMPIFLTVLMSTLPSGLTLYMFVSTLFGVSQQLYFMKSERNRVATTA